MIKRSKYRIVVEIIMLLNMINGQSFINYNFTKVVTKEAESLSENIVISKTNPLSLTFNSHIYNNTNLPNFENYSGLYLPKGSGSYYSFLLKYENKYFTLTAEPQITSNKEFALNIPKKNNLFSVTNDVPINNSNNNNQSSLVNTGFRFNHKGFIGGYSNWDQWWGPGIHNSLTLSNNSKGFYHFFIGGNGFLTTRKRIKYNFKYIVSDYMKNNKGNKYYLSAWFLKVKYAFLELGLNKSILSGGYDNIKWKQIDALKLIINKKNMKYWDSINSYYLMADFKESKLKIFIELGFPNRSYNGNNPDIYKDHAMGSNIGIRKYDAFGNQNLMFGFEYTRLVQSIYYNILPTPNWYDNIKYNFSSYNGRRWAAHSGSDSDDFLIFAGYISKKISFIYGINYERHGVTYHFPPEVKFESRISTNFKYKKTSIYINYENEYFEHYGFVDTNKNVWTETYEEGSLQRTKTILITLEHKLAV